MEAEVRLHFWCVSFLVALAVTAPAVRAQEEKRAQEKAAEQAQSAWPVKIFRVKYADVYRLANLFRAFGATVQPDSDLKVLSVRAPKEVLAAIEESLQRLDVPQPPAKNIQLDAYLLTASAQGTSGSIPAELEPAVKQLRSVFNYQAFRLLGTLTWRGRDGKGGGVNGLLSPMSPDASQPTACEFNIKSAEVASGGKEPSIRINELRLDLFFSPRNGPRQRAQINTSIDVREGQKVVVGKANLDSSDNALILVLTAKVLD
jgi:hypothetical protein